MTETKERFYLMHCVPNDKGVFIVKSLKVKQSEKDEFEDVPLFENPLFFFKDKDKVLCVPEKPGEFNLEDWFNKKDLDVGASANLREG